MKKFLLATSIWLAVSSSFAPAYATSLSGSEIRQSIAGRTVYLATKWGIEFPLRYASNGKVTGDGRGTGLGQYFAPKETGDWWVNGNRMCQKFPTWYDGRTFCFSLEKAQANQLIWRRNDGRSGSARIQ